MCTPPLAFLCEFWGLNSSGVLTLAQQELQHLSSSPSLLYGVDEKTRGI